MQVKCNIQNYLILFLNRVKLIMSFHPFLNGNYSECNNEDDL
jgi:hypothetical protein